MAWHLGTFNRVGQWGAGLHTQNTHKGIFSTVIITTPTYRQQERQRKPELPTLRAGCGSIAAQAS